MKPTESPQFPDLPEEVWSSIHQRVKAFEAAWRAGASGGRRPRLSDHLVASDPSRGQLLIELIHSDLEFRLRAGERARVEDYLADFPELERQTQNLSDLVAAEYYFRKRCEPQTSAAEYDDRFPKLAGIITSLLADDDTDNGIEESAALRDESPLPSVPDYEVIEEIGRGGMGIVYKAVESRLKRTVALKTIRPGAEPSEQERLKREAEAAAALSHPNVVSVHAVFEANDRLYVASEYVSGGTLADRTKGEPLAPRQAAQLLERIARAMAHAHDLGIVHRDLKPSNILITKDGSPKVADFGLAKRYDDCSDLTRTGIIAGSPSYMAPEQALGNKEVDPTTDVWQLGAILYELVTGRPPFRAATTIETLDLVRSADPVPPRRLVPSLPRDLETICLKCLEKDSLKRYPTAIALADDLVRFCRGEAVHARPVGYWGRSLRWAKRNRFATAFLIVLFLTVTGGVTELAVHNAELDQLNEELEKTIEDRDDALADQTQARRQAEVSDRYSRRLLFASDMRLAAEAVREGDLVRAAELLKAHQTESEAELAFVWNHLDRLVHCPHHEIDRLGGAAYFVCFSPDEKVLAACGAAGDIRLYEAETWNSLTSWTANQGELNGLAFSPNGQQLASAGDDGTVVLWNLKNQKEIWRTKVFDKQAYQVGFGLEGAVLAVCGRDTSVVVLDASNGQAKRELIADDTHVEAIVVTPDEQTLISAGYGGNAIAWDLATGAELWKHQIVLPLRSPNNLMSVAVSPNGEFTAFGQREGMVVVVEMGSGRILHNGPFPVSIGSKEPPSDMPWYRAVAFLPDGSLAVASDAGTVYIARIVKGVLERVSEQRTAWLASDGRIGSITAAGHRVVTADRKGAITVFAPDEAEAAKSLPLPWGNGTWVPFSGKANGLEKAVWTQSPTQESSGETFLVDLHNGDARELPGHDNSNWSHWTASTDGRRLFATNAQGQLAGWDASAEPAQRLFFRQLPTKDWDSPMSTTRDGRRMVTDYWRILEDGSEVDEVSVFDGDTGEVVQTRQFPHATCRPTFAADGSVLAISQDTNALLLDPRSLKSKRVLSAHSEKITKLAFTQEGRLLATAGNDRQVILWETATGRQIREWQAESGDIESLVFSPDGKLLLTATSTRPPRLWDVETGRLLLEVGFAFVPKRGESWGAAAFTPDGRRIVVDNYASLFQLDGRPQGDASLARNDSIQTHLAPNATWQSDTQVSSAASEIQQYPVAAALSDGNYVIVWQCRDQTAGTGWDVRVRRYSAEGSALGNETTVNTMVNGEQRAASVAALPNGEYVVAWAGTNPANDTGEDIYLKRYRNDGTPIGDEARANGTVPANQQFPAIASLRDGGFIVCWNGHGSSATESDVYLQRYASDGTVEGGEVRVNETTAFEQQNVSAAGLAAGGYVIVWQSPDPSNETNSHIYHQRYSADGSAVGGDVIVNDATVGLRSTPAVAALDDGGFVVTWAGTRAIGDWQRSDIYFQRYASNGAPVGEETRATRMTSDQRFPSVKGLADGGFALAWTSYHQWDGDHNDVYLQRFNADSSPRGREIRVNRDVRHDQYTNLRGQAVIGLPTDDLLVTWMSSDQAHERWTIRTNRIPKLKTEPARP